MLVDIDFFVISGNFPLANEVWGSLIHFHAAFINVLTHLLVENTLGDLGSNVHNISKYNISCLLEILYRCISCKTSRNAVEYVKSRSIAAFYMQLCVTNCIRNLSSKD